jgi:hypothetical protein
LRHDAKTPGYCALCKRVEAKSLFPGATAAFRTNPLQFLQEFA